MNKTDEKTARIIAALQAAKRQGRTVTQVELCVACGMSYGTCNGIIRALRFAGLAHTSRAGTEWDGPLD